MIESSRRIAVLKAVVALAGAVLMALEILGSRVLAPSYGSSVYVWGSLISTFLAALAIGYALG
ncbi:MAG: spermidine synthase, partial [Thermoanaerobaculia bacterium]